MTYQEWVAKAARMPVDDPRRLGKHYFDLLMLERPEICLKAAGRRAVDPLTYPANLNRFLCFARDSW